MKKRSYSISQRQQEDSVVKRKRTVSASATFVDEERPCVVPQLSLEELALQAAERKPDVERIAEGTPVNVKGLRRVGPYVLGQPLGNSPVKSIVQCLARVPESERDEYYAIKILTLPDDVVDETIDERQGR